MSLTFPDDAKLKDGSPVQLVLADNQDIEPLRILYRVIVEEGRRARMTGSRSRMPSWTVGFAARARWRLMYRIGPVRRAWSGRSASSRIGLGGRDEVKEAVPFVLRRRVMRDAWRTM